MALHSTPCKHSPFEKLYCIAPRLDHLRRFGDGYVLLDEDTRRIFYAKNVVFPKSPEPIKRLKSNEKKSTFEDFYEISDTESEYEEGEVSDGSTQRNNEDSNQEIPQCYQDIIEKINSGPFGNTRSRRAAMTSNEIKRVGPEDAISMKEYGKI